jgi:hypothetical protein
MRSPLFNQNTNRILSIITTLVAILALVILAAGLRNLEFEPGKQFGFLDRPGGLTVGTLPYNFDWLIIALLFSSSITFIVGIILLAVSPEARRIFWRYFRPILFLLTLYALMLYLTRPTDEKLEEPLTTPFAQPAQIDESPVLEEVDQAPYTIPDILPWQRYLTGTAIILLVGLTGYAIWLKYKPPENEFAEITLSALSDLRSGRDWEDAVIQCYVRMEMAVRQQRHLNRNQSMTPREFATHLGHSGLPAEPVIHLTRLFEKARYSSRSSGTDERNKAIDCLTDILETIQEAE